ncbi:M48 family metallopeptidase [Reinekea blandensis]|uniref:Putative peptidase n=1 Tax=Reinekea blandensis MED297 TaxID=314283 RepID=A4B9T4_9GAMM|nr:M48 family metallopeptidase [Reinekea blandensis]EAR11385.1 putative peptidase [Reinekea sp. MED297] [Reinekea blandensis MED297]
MTSPDDYEPLQENPQLPETINAPKVSIVHELWLLSAGVLATFLLLAVMVWLSLGWLAQFIPLSWEDRLIQPVAQSWQTDATEQAQLQQRIDQLLVRSEYSDLSVQVHILSSSELNAFATLGGQIFVTEGLLSALESEVGLDFVLLHELAHLVHRDPIRAAASQLGVRLLTALAIGQSDLGAPTAWLQSTELLLSRHYSREQEIRADDFAFTMLQRVYGDVEGYDEFFVTLLEQGDTDRFPAFLSTHPHTQYRLDRLRQRLD